MQGASSTITNIGSAGGQWFTPVLNYPEAAILGIGRIAEQPVVRDGEIVIAPVLALSLSFDHRIVDGATAQLALNQIKDRKSTRLNSSHVAISYAVFCLKKKKKTMKNSENQQNTSTNK